MLVNVTNSLYNMKYFFTQNSTLIIHFSPPLLTFNPANQIYVYIYLYFLIYYTFL